MRKETPKYKCVLPPEIMIDILNQVEGTDLKIIEYYTPYMKKLATKNIYSKDGRCIGRILDEDLLQEMKVNIIKSMPAIRRMLLQKTKKNNISVKTEMFTPI